MVSHCILDVPKELMFPQVLMHVHMFVQCEQGHIQDYLREALIMNGTFKIIASTLVH